MIMRYAGICCCFLLIAASGCGSQDSGASKKSEPPARVESPAKEADLTKVHLTEEADRRLGISLTPVERKSVALTRIFGGTTMIPQGGTLRITAPFGGTILTGDADLPHPGAWVRKDQRLLRLVPVFAGEQEVLSSPERLSLAKAQADLATSRAEAEGQVSTSEAQLQAAKAQLDRADKLRREGAGSQQTYEEALAATRKAEADLQAARSRLQVLASIHLEMQPTSAPSLDIEAPLDSIVSGLYVRGGLEVPAGTPLIELTTVDPIWVRASIYVGEQDTIAPGRGVKVSRVSSGVAVEVPARQLEAAPAGNSNAGTVDLFFEIPNPQRSWSPDEKVIVRIPLKSQGEESVVPWSAVIHDVHGGSWVYVNTGPHTYVRQRVEVREVVDSLAVLVRGPLPGTPVVTAGAAELFGTEFGAGK